MRYLFITILTWLCLVGGASAEEVVTGSGMAEARGGAEYEFVYTKNDKFMVGCGPSSDLSQEMLDYLSDHFDAEVSIAGDVVTSDMFGKCIDNPRFVVQKKLISVPDEVAGIDCDLSKYDKITLLKEVDPASICTVKTIFESNYYDPIFETTVTPFTGIYEYLTQAGYELIVGKTVRNGVSAFDFIFKEKDSDFAMAMPLTPAYGEHHPKLQKQLKKQPRYTPCKSFLSFKSAAYTSHYSQDKWRRLSAREWIAIMKPIIEKGYVNEVQ